MPLFGNALPNEGPTPDIFLLSLNHLELHALEVEGIFRVSGQKARIEEMKTEFETGKRVEFTENDDIHDVSGLFRMWLQLLPEPIIPYEFYDKMVECGKLDKKKARAALKTVVDELPPLRRSMLQKLIRLLRLLSLYHDTNKMTASNLAVVMGPNICRAQTMGSTMEALAHVQCVTNATIFLIDDYELILPREPPSEDRRLTHVKRSSRALVEPLALADINRSGAGSKDGAREAEDAITSQLSLSLSDLKPDVLLTQPKSARSAPRARARGPSANAKRGFSNALEWLVTSVQEDALEEQIAEEDTPAAASTAAVADITSDPSSLPSTPRGEQSSTSGSSSKKRSTRKSKTTSDGSTVDFDLPAQVDSPVSSASSAPKKERSKRLKSENSTNSTASSTSEPPSPRSLSLGDSMKSNGSTSSSSSTKKKSKSKLAASDSLDVNAAPSTEETKEKSPRRKIPPPSREGSLKADLI